MLAFRAVWARLVVALAAALTIGLIAAAPVQIGTAPVLIVYPFAVGPSLKPEAGIDFATRIANAIGEVGGVKTSADVASARTPGEYPAAARAAGADFYLTGFVSPVGGTVTVIQQLVSVRSGTIVWSNSAQVLTAEDAAAQAALIHTAITQYSSRGFYALGLVRPTPAASTKQRPRNGLSTSGSSTSGAGGAAPAKPAAGAARDLPNEAYGYSSAPTPPPRVYASAAHPSRYAVLSIAGKTAPADMRDYAANALIYALGRHGQTASLADPETSAHPLLRGAEICTQTGASVLVWGTLATVSSDSTKGTDIWTDATMNIYAWDCGAGQFERNAKADVGSAFRWKSAIDHAADQAVSSYLLRFASKAAAG